jgi:hypothetical protein
MQEEIRKHSKKAVSIIKSSNHSALEKVKEIGIEIFIIVFAVSFSIWLHSWSEHRHQQKEVKEFLTDLKEDLKGDIESQIEARKVYLKTIESFNYIINLSEKQYDNLSSAKDSTSFKSNLSTKMSSFPNIWLKSRSGNYEGFKSSGKIGFIENKKLKKLILEYYEQAMPGAAMQDEYNRQMAMKTIELISDIDGNGKKIIFNKKVRTYLQYIIMMSNESLENYQNTTKLSQDIVKKIDE